MTRLGNRITRLEGNIGPRLEVAPVFQIDSETGEVKSAWVTGSGIIDRHQGEELHIFQARIDRAYASRSGIDEMTDEAVQTDLDFLKAHVEAVTEMTDKEVDPAIESRV